MSSGSKGDLVRNCDQLKGSARPSKPKEGRTIVRKTGGNRSMNGPIGTPRDSRKWVSRRTLRLT
eukprot:648230-Heterocapsa_arctica.AAC.1